MRRRSLAYLVAAREITSRTRSNTFRVGTLLSLLIVAALVVIPSLRAHHEHTYHVGLVGSSSPELRQAVGATGAALGAKVEVHQEPDLASAEEALRNGQLDLVVEDGQRLLVETGIGPNTSTSFTSFVSAVSGAVALHNGLVHAGIAPGQALSLAHPPPLPVASLKPAPRHPVPLGTALIVTVLLFALLQQYGAWVLVGVVEEKVVRVVEVLLAAVRPNELLTGKVVGIGAVALIQAGLTVGVALVLASIVGSSILHGAGPAFIAVSAVWFLLGYAFYCWMFAAAGSMVSRQEDAQNVAFPLLLPLLAGYLLVFTAFVAGHASPAVVVLGYVPFTAPLLMPTLIALGQANWWEVVLSMLITLGATFLVARLAAGIYARGVLHTGRQLKWREVVPALARRTGTTMAEEAAA
ncbi:MAG TPA: ABC transporter permease [Acidimicrobiales bacterium]|nr:ABC transporter permease [Acidimicrobiales bacterium]